MKLLLLFSVFIIGFSIRSSRFRRSISRCTGSPTLGNRVCRATVERFTFDKKKGCVPIIFGGCNAAPNNFKTLKECREMCTLKSSPTTNSEKHDKKME
ncbi:hypothetical protein Q1695_008659 [Nippostrongylus brasiliensis]|nr:hypothetical protein Q1695_008659 [Nippostrongylus brasiliensis]